MRPAPCIRDKDAPFPAGPRPRGPASEAADADTILPTRPGATRSPKRGPPRAEPTRSVLTRTF
eukprot:4683693-Pyramimonas_sp.AAC.1